MAKGQMRSNKEKKKPKQDKNKKDKGAARVAVQRGTGPARPESLRQEGSMRRRVTRGARIEASPRARPATRTAHAPEMRRRRTDAALFRGDDPARRRMM